MKLKQRVNISKVYSEDFGIYLEARKKLVKLNYNNNMTAAEYVNEILKIFSETGILSGEMSCNIQTMGNNMGE
jgi:hypothetical protein